MPRTARLTAALIAALVLLVACGGDSDDGDDGTATTAEAASDATTAATGGDEAGGDEADADEADGELPDDVEEMAEDMVDDLEEAQEAVGGGGATLTVGDESWTFDSVLCAMGEDEIGQEGAELVVSAIDDGLQLYVSIDSFGHSVSLDDVEDFEDPRVSLSADPFTAQFLGEPEEFVVVDGDDVSAEAVFDDGTTDDIEGLPGTLEATCP